MDAAKTNSQFGLCADMDCSHHLVGAGICEQPHGHTFRVEAQWRFNGSLAQPEAAKAALKAQLARFDHQDLNQHFEFPSAENLAQELASRLEETVPGLAWLRVWEGEGAWAEAEPH